MLSLNSILLSEVQPAKQASPNSLTELGSDKLCKDLQFANAQTSIVLNRFGRVTFLREKQFLNA